MIQEELRIGSLVKLGHKIVFVLEITVNGISYDSIDGDLCAEFAEWEEVKPIPLTEQWLLYFGFIRDDCMHCWYDEEGNLTIRKSRLGFFPELVIGSPPFEYVHQLQNLYFALTGSNRLRNKKLI